MLPGYMRPVIFGHQKWSRHEGHHHAADHHVVEVGDDEVSAMRGNIGSQRSEKQTGKPADREQPDKAEHIEHRRIKGDRALVHASPSN